MNQTADVYVGAAELTPEPMPSLSDVAQEAGGNWPKGWYPGEIIAGYTAGGYEFTTSDAPSKNGDSRNLRVAVRVTSPTAKSDDEGNTVAAGAARNTFVNRNYRTTDLTSANVSRIKNKQGDVKDKEYQRLGIVLGQLGQIEKAIGFQWQRHPQGHLLAEPLIGQKVDVRLSKGEKGYDEITAFAPAGTRTKGSK